MPQTEDSRSRDLLIFAVVVVVVGAIGMGFDELLVKEGVKRLDIIALSNGLTGIAAGLLYFQITRIERERRATTQRQLRTIAEMNHHIRNALQIIAYASTTTDKTQSVELISQSVERIEWALREVLPGHVTREANASPAEHEEQSTPARKKLSNG
jgi:hypothetical protein